MHENKQIIHGEFGDFFGDEARSSKPEDFARKYQSPIHRGLYLDRVTVNGIDYFWDKEGKYDGHGRTMK